MERRCGDEQPLEVGLRGHDLDGFENAFRVAVRKLSGPVSYSSAVAIFLGVNKLVTGHDNSGRRIEVCRSLARLIVSHLLVDNMPRYIRSLALTVMSRRVCDAKEQSEPARSRQLSWFGPVLDSLAETSPEECVQWFVDLASGEIQVQDNGSAPRKVTTGEMRWVLSGTHAGSLGMQRFWTVATSTSGFPDCIFKDPGDSGGRKCYLTAAQVRQLGAFFAYAPAVAVERFGQVLRAQVRDMRYIAYGRLRTPYGILEASSAQLSFDGLPAGIFPSVTGEPRFYGLTKLFPNVQLEVVSDAMDCGNGMDATLTVIPVPEEKRPAILRAIMNQVQQLGRECVGKPGAVDLGRLHLVRSIFFPNG
ncbi:MAG: hypothetical protein ABIJ46_03970 [bacterium]